MLYILDTDHISMLQRGHPVILQQISRVPVTDRATTIVSLVEQFLGWWDEIARAKSEIDATPTFRRLQEAMTFFHTLPMLPYDHSAVLEFQRLRHAKIRIGAQDLRIAAIALSQNATVVTRNLRDFRQVPGLLIVDWSTPTA